MKTTLYRDNTTLRWILFGTVLRHVITDSCRMELIGASACYNLQGRPLTVSLTWLPAGPP